jgi:hypothetical protein
MIGSPLNRPFTFSTPLIWICQYLSREEHRLREGIGRVDAILHADKLSRYEAQDDQS